MQILVLVMTILMLITIMTYGRLESFRHFGSLQSKFKTYMEESERAYINKMARKHYDDKKFPTGPEERNQQVEAISTLNFKPFVNKTFRESNPEEFLAELEMAKNLIEFLYGEAKFYKEAKVLRPDLLNALFQHLMKATEEQDVVEVKEPKSIANVDLGDSLLNKVLTNMLAGTAEKSSASGKYLIRNPTAPDRLQHIRSEKGYLSLLDFITIKKNYHKIRIYLASSQVLMALYGNIDTVTQIVQFRKDLQRQLNKKNGIDKQAASEIFRQQFSNLQRDNVPSRLLEFSVTTTDPNENL